MRRVGVQAFRTARRLPVRSLVRTTPAALIRSHHALASRSSSFAKAGVPLNPTVLQSSIIFRNYVLAFVSTLVASGAWYAYKDNGVDPSTGLSTGPNGSAPVAFVNSSSVVNGQSSILNTESLVQPSLTQPLVISGDQLYATTSLDHQPLSKSTDDSGQKSVGMLTPEEATRKLRRNEESYQVGRGKGVVRYDVMQLPSNDPIEDDHAERIVEVPSTVSASAEGAQSNDWMFWGVFDGHSGWTTSARLRQALIPFVARELNATYQAASSKSSATYPSPEAIDAAIKQGFVRLDHEIVHGSVEKAFKDKSRSAAADLLAPALSGSCALLAFYDTDSRMLRVACTGDSRAVLGQKSPNGKWTATALSEDQTGSTSSEAERLRQEHPGEQHVVRNGRVLGNLEPTRAFGDAFYKWQKDVQLKIQRQFFGRTPHQLLKTPPYVTAEPVVTSAEVDPSKDNFVVLATDGLWEMLTNEEVVGLVGQWIEQQRSNSSEGVKGWLGSWFGSETQLPVEQPAQQDGSTGQRMPIRQQQYKIPSANSRFVVEDKNAATHLARNALGGKDKDTVCALLTLPSPYSRRYRDDLTIQVIFFGEADKTGVVTMNSEATASADKAQPKL